MFGEFAADGHPSPAYGTDQIPSTRQLANLQLLAKPEIPQPITTRTTQNSNGHIAAHPNLVQGHGTVDFQVVCKRSWHLEENPPIETDLQQQKLEPTHH